MWAGQPERHGTTLSSRLRSSLMMPRASTIEPVGQTSAQAPQKRHPASWSESPLIWTRMEPSSARAKPMAPTPRSCSQARTQRPQRMQRVNM